VIKKSFLLWGKDRVQKVADGCIRRFAFLFNIFLKEKYCYCQKFTNFATQNLEARTSVTILWQRI
jgi:hypothetical protein